MTADITLHEAPHVGDIGGNDPERESSQLFGVLGSYHFDSHT